MAGYTVIGRGVMNWPRAERQTDRYGLIMLGDDWEKYINDTGGYVPLDESAAGQVGSLIAVVLETRDSPHIGDLARGIRPQTPTVGDAIVLGHGTLFFEDCDDWRVVGVKPLDGRRADWMDPHMLYRAVHQTVEVRFQPAA